jgi:hypothetical protein
MNLKIQVLLMTVFMAVFVQAHEGVVRIPLKTFTKPASNLLDSSGKPLQFADLARMNDSKQDLSKLQPVEDKYWQNKKFSAIETEIHKLMPDSETGVTLDSYLGANRELGYYSIVVKPSNGKAERYGLTLGLQTHASLLKSALLRKLGYFQQSPRHYDKIKLSFANGEEKALFIKRAFCEEGPDVVSIDCLSITPFKSETDKREILSEAGPTSLYVHGAYLEKMDNEIPSLFDGLTPADSSSISYFASGRQFRALLVPFVIGDIQESLGRVAPESVLIRDGWAYITYGFSDYFSQTGEDDVKWMLRRVAQLTDADWNEIVAAADLPESLNQLAKATIMSRAQNMMNWFFDAEAKSMMKASIPSFDYSSKDGLVLNGRITQEYIPGEPHRFTHGERQSPFESGDFLKYMSIKSQSSAITVAVNKLQDILKLQRTKITSQKVTGARLLSNGQYAPVGSANGREFGLNFGASRIVTTGTYFGSEAAVQLVDNVNLRVGVGLFRMVNDITGINTMFGGNVSYMRDFTHVVPIDTMKSVDSVINPLELYVPSRLHKIASPLKDGKLSDFFANFKNGEVFTITESVGAGAQLGFAYALDALMGFAGQVPSVGLNAGANGVLLRQVQITKTPTGFQVFIRNQNTAAFSLTVDVNYFINLLKIKHDTTLTDLHTDAYILNSNQDFITQVSAAIDEVKKEAIAKEEDPAAAVDTYFSENPELAKRYESQKGFSDKMAGAFRALIFQSNTEPLARDFRKQVFEIDHNLKTKEWKTKFLWWRSTKLTEEHLLRIYKPVLTDVGSGEVENKPIEVVTYRKGKLTGKDVLGLGLNVLDYGLGKVAKGYAPTLSQESQNPSQMPFGRAQWHIVRTDTELTQNREGALPTVAVIQNVWGGWSIKKKDLDVILQKLRDKFSSQEFVGTEFQNKELIPDQRFRLVKKIDFFRITENLSLLPTAMEKIKSLLINPDTTGATIDKMNFLDKFFSRVFEGKDRKPRADDKVIFNNLMSVIGGGDEAAGRAHYMEQCKANKQQAQAGKQYGQTPNTTTWYKGTKYECLEGWVDDIIGLARQYVRSDVREQNRIMTELIYVLEENIPLPVLLQALGKENYLYFIEVTGFRKGDENADEAFSVSNVLGEPAKKHPYSNGLISVFSEKTKIIPIELDRSQGSFQ